MNIRVASLFKTFGENELFKNINLEIEQNEITALTGGSGCGKTTLLRMICGLDKDYTGQISGVPERISFLFQEDRLLPWYNVRKNIEFVLKDSMGKDEMNGAVSDMIAAVQLDGHELKLPSELSGGMQRRVAMARAFCCPSSLLIMDEPFKGFDKKLNLELISLFKRLHTDHPRTVLLVAHETELIDILGCKVIDVEALSAARRAQSEN